MKLKVEVEGKTYEVTVEVVEGAEDFYMPFPQAPAPRRAGGGRSSRPSGPAPAAPRPAGPSAPAGKGTVTSPLAGNIWKVLVEPGQKVEADQTLIIIEAMKMETNIQAPFAGTVKAVHVKPGDAVKVNQALVELDEAE
ncbi:MAG: biotin/lipoyl-binding protein [Fimbriimonadales bacterium]|nr:biotin/lipoyl-binding protein [Fimbriimonadales bacterium]